ncbi:MAG: helix-turn-helix domain-containing protein [archaeon]
MDLTTLKEIGLTDGEVKVYLSLLKLGLTKTGQLANNAGVSSSKVYKILARLEKKGLVSHTIKEGVTNYRALEPKRILDYIDEEKSILDEKRSVVEAMLPNLIKQMRPVEGTQATLYTGFKAITNFFRNILDELGAGDVYYVIGANYPKELPELMPFFYKYHQLRAQKKIKVMMLANNDIGKNIVPTTWQVSEIRFLPNYLMTNMQILFYKHKTLLIVWSADPVAFLIESEDISKSFKKYFDAFWKVAKK